MPNLSLKKYEASEMGKLMEDYFDQMLTFIMQLQQIKYFGFRETKSRAAENY